MTKTYRVGIIGRTAKGNYGHGLDTVWAGIPIVEVVAVADEDEKGRTDAAKRTRAGVAVRLELDLHGDPVSAWREPNAGGVPAPSTNSMAFDPSVA